MTSKASSTGTLVKRLTTSKLTRTSLFRMVVRLMHSTKADESFTYESVVPLRGFRILTSSLASWCVEEPLADTIGRRGSLPCALLGDHRSVVHR